MFQKGNKLGTGRPPGAKNVTTRMAKALLLEAVGGELENLSDHLKRIKNPKDRVDALSKLLGYVLPRQTFLELEDNGTPRSWIEKIDLTILPEHELKLILSAFKTQENGQIGAATED